MLANRSTTVATKLGLSRHATHPATRPRRGSASAITRKGGQWQTPRHHASRLPRTAHRTAQHQHRAQLQMQNKGSTEILGETRTVASILGLHTLLTVHAISTILSTSTSCVLVGKIRGCRVVWQTPQCDSDPLDRWKVLIYANLT